MTGAPGVCARCGQTHDPAKCTSHVDLEDGTLRPCRAWPIRGGSVCKDHGGSAGQVRAAANRNLELRETERAVERTLGELGVAIPTSDGDALTELRDRYRGIVHALWRLAADLKLVPEADVVAGLGTDGIYGRTYHQTGRATGEAKPHVVMVMLGDWSDRLAKIDEACVRLGLSERRVRATEAQSQLVWAAVDQGLRRALPPELYDRARRSIGQAASDLLAEISVPGLPAGTEGVVA